MIFYLLIVFLFSVDKNRLPLETKQNIPIEEQVTMEVIMDASGSMMQKIGDDYKIIVAKNLMKSFLLSNSKIPSLDLAFRVYGSVTGTCDDSKIILGFEELNTKDIISEVSSVNPKPLAKTLLAKSLELAGNDLRTRKGKKIIFLVTDGEETCEGDPCEVAKNLLKEFDIKIEVIGFAIKGAEAEKQLNCIATAGAAMNVDNPASLSEAMNKINNKYSTKNLKVKSIDNSDAVAVYTVSSDLKSKKKLFRKFQAGIDQFLPPTGKNEKYEVIVMVEPNYTFPTFTLAKFEEKVLQVKGEGNLTVSSVSDILSFSLLNANGKEIKKIKSSEKLKLQAGKYSLSYEYPPYVSFDSIPVKVYPNANLKLATANVGGLYLRTNRKESTAYYILDKEGKTEIGTFVSEKLALLKTGSYRINIFESTFVDVEISPNEISFLEIE